MRQYQYSYRERMSTGKGGVVEASSPSEAAYKIARMLGYQGRQTFQGRQYNYISECGEFDGSVPLCIAVRLVSNEPKAVRYYKCTQ